VFFAAQAEAKGAPAPARSFFLIAARLGRPLSIKTCGQLFEAKAIF